MSVLMTDLPKNWVLESPPPFPLFVKVLERLREPDLEVHTTEDIARDK